VTIADKNEKEKFASALATVLAPGLFFHNSEYKKIRTTLTWTDSKLTVTDYYKREKENEVPTNLHVFFTGDRISNISLK
jgi:hypothetical protein